MFCYKMMRPTLIKGILFLSLFIGLSFAQQSTGNKPFTYNEIVLLIPKIGNDELCKQIKASKVSFKLTNIMTAKLVSTGGNEGLISCIETNFLVKSDGPDLAITSPQPGDNCGTDVQVKGTTVIFSEKYLWVFVHRRGLSKWWPQSGAVEVDSTGDWVQGVTLGEHRDIGFQFEIKAMWLDKNTNAQVSQTLTNWESQHSWPGMTLPQGMPVVSVMVNKAHD